MRVIITGGTGLIGRALAKQLAEEGHDVVVLTRDPDKASGFSSGVRLVKWDARTAQGWAEWVEGADAIVNLAGAGLADRLWTKSRKQMLVNSRVWAGQAIAEAVTAAKQKPRVLIQASAVGFYGPRKDEPISENEPQGDDFLADLCRKWEDSSASVEPQGVRRVIIRTGLVLSSAGGVLPRLMLPIRLFVGGRVGSGRQYYPWIHLDDQVRAIRFLIDQPSAQGPFNLVAPNPLTNAEFIQSIGRAVRRPTWLPLPEFALRLLVGDLATVLVDGQRAIPTGLVDAGFDFNYPTLEEAMQALV
jgi:uncharacterized protein (TIGR01777 family)